MMATHLVDVTNKFGSVMHTFPVSIEEKENLDEDSSYHEKALIAATFSGLAPGDELQPLSATDHISRGGQLQPYGDRLSALCETKAALEQATREHAYFLLEGDGRPEGCDEYYWSRAFHDHLKEGAYLL